MSLTRRHNARATIGRVIIILLAAAFVLVFMGVGGRFAYQEWRASRQFLPVTGTITKSEVGRSTDRDGTTYYPDITFRYEVDGRVYRDGTYTVSRTSSSGRAGKQRIVDQHPVGAERKVWYDPTDPAVAVLNTDMTWFPWVFIGIGAVIPGIAILIIVSRGWSRQARKANLAASGLSVPVEMLTHVNPRNVEQLGSGRVRLRGATTGKGVKMGLGLLAAAVFWNGITWTLVLVLWSESGGAWKWGPMAFMSIFVVIGAFLFLGGVWKIITSIMVGRRIMPASLTIDRLPLRLGERFTVEFEQQTRSACQINRVTVTLFCQEWVRYTVGTDTRTAEHTVLERKQTVLEQSDAYASQQITGRCEFEIPIGAMHSFDAANNKVKWMLKLHTDIAGWPDYASDFPIAVVPRIVPGVGEPGRPPIGEIVEVSE